MVEYELPHTFDAEDEARRIRLEAEGEGAGSGSATPVSTSARRDTERRS